MDHPNSFVFQPTVLFAMFGGLAIKLLELTELRKVPKADRPDFKELIYWLPYLIGPVLGGGLCYVYVMSDVAMKPILAMNVGISAPLILRAMAEVNPLRAPTIEPGSGA